MFKTSYQIIAVALVLAATVFAASCTDDLNTSPLDESVISSNVVYDTPEDFRQVLAKLYAGFATTGQQGPAGNPDIQGIDEGFSSYVRQLWVNQVIPTDEAVVAWNDPGLPDFNTQNWNASNDFVLGMYSRIFYQIPLTNEFIREAQQRNEDVIAGYLNEARFLRALSYWHALDLYGGNVPFVTEDNPIGADMPEQTNAEDLFEYIESELLAIEGDLPATRENEYGRVDQAAAWTLLSKLYLNAEVYIGQERYSDARAFAEKVLDDGGYYLEENYEHLFLADNDNSSEIIMPVRFHGQNTRTFGGTNFIIHAAVGGDMSASEFGINGGWAGHRVTPEFVEKFDQDNDGRALFHTEGQNLEIDDISDFRDGYAVTKWKNVNSDGSAASSQDHVDTDFPMFRIADVYLMYAEAVLRGGGGDETRALNYVNELRERAYGDQSGNITAAELDLEFILDERARELYWEGHRRTDLVRFGLFTSDQYVWAYKGGEQEGTGTSDHFNIYPIPASDVNANLNLFQNDGY